MSKLLKCNNCTFVDYEENYHEYENCPNCNDGLLLKSTEDNPRKPLS